MRRHLTKLANEEYNKSLHFYSEAINRRFNRILPRFMSIGSGATLTPVGGTLLLKAHHEMGPMGLGQRFSFTLERDDVRARLCDRLG